MAAKTPRFDRFSVNTILGFAEVEVHGGITRLEKKVRTVCAELARRAPAGSFTVPSKAQWRHHMCGTKDVYLLRLEINHSTAAVQTAMYDMLFDRPFPVAGKSCA